ncbi:MAG TPA: septum site-determining protein MinC [Polyangiales bacterium]|nr:septum site-determining protein MinC [Polyangiales bacterium]
MATEPAKAIELQGVMTALHVLRVLTPELQAIAAALDKKIEQMPSLFTDAPVAIDLRALEPDAPAGRATPSRLRLAPLIDLLKTRGLIPVAVRSGAPGRIEEARAAGIGVLEWDRSGPAKKPRASQDNASESVPAPAQTLEAQGSLTLLQPLRAGQIVYAEGADAIALAAVNTGAELIADGNVHVYAPLRGRALAGARGNDNARIFCQKLEAELVSIAGVYVTSDDLPADKLGKPVQIALRDGSLVITELNTR